jgi:hypothetical protein
VIFRFALRRATRLAELQGKIESDDAALVYEILARPWRYQKGVVGGRRVNILKEVEDDIVVQAAAVVGHPINVGFDWQSILDWIVANLPTIIQLIISLITIFAEPAPEN